MTGIKLEIDEDILKNQLLINEPKDELDTLFPKTTTSTAAMVKPKPGICVKTQNTLNNTKVFINVCTSEKIPSPEDISDEELIAIFESDEPSDFKVPMSIGSPHEEEDKSGNSCMVYDVIINPTFFEKMSNDPLFHNFFMIVTCEGLEEKFNTTLDKNSWTVLKNRKCIGNVSEQTVRTPLPLVQELSGIKEWKPEDFTSKMDQPKTEQVHPLITEITTKKLGETMKSKQKPKFTMEKTLRYGSDKPPLLQVEIELPEVIMSEEIRVDVGEDRILVESGTYFLDEFLPYTLDASLCKAYFIKRLRMLVLLLSYAELR